MPFRPLWVLALCEFWLMRVFPGPKSRIRREPPVCSTKGQENRIHRIKNNRNRNRKNHGMSVVWNPLKANSKASEWEAAHIRTCSCEGSSRNSFCILGFLLLPKLVRDIEYFLIVIQGHHQIRVNAARVFILPILPSLNQEKV